MTMFMTGPRALAVAGGLSLLLGAAAGAATTTYTSRAAFEAALGTRVTDDYENPAYAFVQSDAAMTAVLGQTAYRPTGHLHTNIVFHNVEIGSRMYCAGCNGSYRLDLRNTSVSERHRVFGVGFDYLNMAQPVYAVFVTFGDGSTADVALDATGTAATNFFGIASSIGIRSLHLGLAGGGTTQDGSFAQDNLTIGSAAAVPEPRSRAMLALGLLGVGLSRHMSMASRRRSRVIAR